MNRRKISLVEIAKQLNTSVSTVSRALNNHPGVNEQLRKKIFDKAEEVGYVPNSSAISMQSGRKSAIGVIVPNVNRNFFSSAIEGIEEQAYKIGIDIIIAHSNNSAEREQKIVEMMAGRVDGVIASLSMDKTDHAYYNRLHKIGIPLVLFDRVADNVISGKVTVDDYAGGLECTQHLIEQGCRKIFHFAGPQHIQLWERRLLGYKHAMEQAGLPVERHCIHEQIPTAEFGEEYATHLIAKGNLPDAIFFAGDYAAVGAMCVFAKHGIRMPEDIAIVGFANEPFCQYLTPQLSSVEQSSFRMGALSFSMIMDSLSGHSSMDITIQPQLIVRDSSRRVR